jgi:hypothetical protein
LCFELETICDDKYRYFYNQSNHTKLKNMTIGKFYKILDYKNNKVRLINDIGKPQWYTIKRFLRSLQFERSEKLKKYMKKLFIHPNGPIFKKGENIICVEDIGIKYQLTIGKSYKVIESYRKYNANEVSFIGDTSLTSAFSSRFTTIKSERRKKLKKIIKNERC